MSTVDKSTVYFFFNISTFATALHQSVLIGSMVNWVSLLARGRRHRNIAAFVEKSICQGNLGAPVFLMASTNLLAFAKVIKIWGNPICSSIESIKIRRYLREKNKSFGE